MSSDDRQLLELEGVSSDHGLSDPTMIGFVNFRAQAMNGTVLFAQISPSLAREIALKLLEAAARAEYEQDLAQSSIAEGVSRDSLLAILAIVRLGEADRHGGRDEG